jgi:uncharacterized protein (DUF488 family)
MPPVFYTIGHSNHSSEEFLALLSQHRVQCLVDVRSQPYSRYNPQFNREALSQSLTDAHIRYVYLGESLGGRPEQSDLYDPGSERPNYDRQRETPLYRQGLQRLMEIGRATPTAYMCSEGDPEQCHRTRLITWSLLDLGYTVIDILPDGSAAQAERPAEQLGFGF